jgi:hypothetical protein
VRKTSISLLGDEQLSLCFHGVDSVDSFEFIYGSVNRRTAQDFATGKGKEVRSKTVVKALLQCGLTSTMPWLDAYYNEEEVLSWYWNKTHKLMAKIILRSLAISIDQYIEYLEAKI